ncbi:MAG: GtrA family protein [Pseudomonadota bacterium]
MRLPGRASPFWRYVVNGALITVLYFALSSLLAIYIESKLLVSQIAYFPIFFIAFFTHKYRSFRSGGRITWELAKFAVVQLTSFFLISLVLVEAFSHFGLTGNVVFIAIIVTRACLNYLFLRFFVFRGGERQRPQS